MAHRLFCMLLLNGSANAASLEQRPQDHKPPLRLRGGGVAQTMPTRSRGISRLLGWKSILTVIAGLPVLCQPLEVLKPLGFKLITPHAIHMTKMWGVWMCLFQALLEATFAMHVEGLARNLFVLVEGVFEIALLLEVMWDRRLAEPANKYSEVIELMYMLTVLIFFGVLLFAPDPVEDRAKQRRALWSTGALSVLMLAAQLGSLIGGVDYGGKLGK